MKQQLFSNTAQLCACPGCDLVLEVKHCQKGHLLTCPRCHHVLHRKKVDSLNRVLSLAITGLFLYFPAIFMPLITMESLGMKESSNVIQSVLKLFESNYHLVALMVFFSAVIFPLLLLGLIFIVAISIKMGRKPACLTRFLRWYLHLQEWGMVEVYMLGIIITIIKMTDSASISYNTGFFCFLFLVITSIGITSVLDKWLFWSLLDSNEDADRAIHSFPISRGTNARDNGLVACHSCEKLLHQKEFSTCPRCHSALHSRTPGSITKTWALVLTSAILFIPANLLPIMQVDFLGVPDRSTIMDGIIYFFKHGDYPIGLIIFAASILVPLFKVVGLIIILFTVRSRKNRYLLQKAKMFRFIEFIGRWSMLDIFVIALLAVLVDFGFLTSVHAAPAATYFCMVVVFTMLAAITFDPRIMWDKCYQKTPGT